MASLLNDLKSLVGSSSSKPEAVPAVGDHAPALEDVTYTERPHILAFVRHCGCPFAEREVRALGAVHEQHPEVGILITSHSAKETVDDWFGRIGKPHFDDMNNVKVIADPEYERYNRFGIGQLGWTKILNGTAISELKSLASEGIKNTTTGDGSNRWLNSGGFCVDKEGVVRFAKVAEEASDTVDYETAVKTVL